MFRGTVEGAAGGAARGAAGGAEGAAAACITDAVVADLVYICGTSEEFSSPLSLDTEGAYPLSDSES